MCWIPLAVVEHIARTMPKIWHPEDLRAAVANEATHCYPEAMLSAARQIEYLRIENRELVARAYPKAEPRDAAVLRAIKF